MGAGVAISLIAAGATVRFALAPGSPHGLDVHVAGVVLMLAGALGLLLSLLLWGPLNPARRRRGSPRSEMPLLVRAEKRLYQGQPPLAAERRRYRDQPPS